MVWIFAGVRSYLPDKDPKPTLELIGANVTDDEKSLQDPMKELHDAIVTAIIKFEDETPRTKVAQIELKRDSPGSRTLRVLVHVMSSP
jgi:hypothetical protein